MKDGVFEVIENKRLTPTTYRMKLRGDISEISAPGQFINIKLDGHYLRRPISVCDLDHGLDGSEGVVTIIYKVLGRGTEEMTKYELETKLDILTGLGNGYSLEEAGEGPLLIGGGVGIPPLYLTARLLTKASNNGKVTVILGFNSADEVYYVDEFKALGCDVIVTTADGSVGERGFVTDAFKRLNNSTFSHFYTCGPEPMLRAVYQTVYKEAGIDGHMSFEERMGCGFGACMGCSCKTVTGYKRICKDGPVLRTDEILW